MEAIFLEGVGKKIRKDYLNKKIPDSKVIELYKHNEREASDFSSFGFKSNELVLMLRKCHNPLLREKLKDCIKLRDELSKKSAEQNKLSLEKLSLFKKEALGIGLRKVIRTMKKASRKEKSTTLKIVTLLLETEFANLSAKDHPKYLKNIIYERKGRLLLELSSLLKKTNWKYGYNDNSGKNANYLVYIYLPNNVQLCWHSNDYSITSSFPTINCDWDGKSCATLEKILEFIKTDYSYLFKSIA